MVYPKKIMKLSELIGMGFPKEFLMRIYRNDKKIARKMNPALKNSPIIFDTDKLEKLMQEESKNIA